MPDTTEIVHSLYCGFFERGIRYFLPEAALVPEGEALVALPRLVFHSRTDGTLDLDWMGTRYHLSQSARPFSEDQLRLIAAVGAVLSARYRSIFSAVSAASTASIFEGLAEDRYVSAFLDHTLYLGDVLPSTRDIVANAIEVMRESSLLTYENRRIASGAILLGSGPDPFHTPPALPAGALPYTHLLVAIKSLHRLCDGIRTAFLVDRAGMLVDLVDMQGFAGAHRDLPLPAPSSARYHAHSVATLRGGHICLVLTPNGEIKIFAGGVQVFNFLEGRWHLNDIPEKYRAFQRAVGSLPLAHRLFTAALNLSEHRRGGLFVVLDNRADAPQLASPQDLLENDQPADSGKSRVHYLLRRKNVLTIEASVLESIARVDGGILLDRSGDLLAFGAILRNSGEYPVAQDGGRTTAAVQASHFGPVLKISEDGQISLYCSGSRLWEI